MTTLVKPEAGNLFVGLGLCALLIVVTQKNFQML